MFRKITLLFYLLLLITGAYAQEEDKLFEKGIKAYNIADYEQSIIYFNQIIEKGKESSSLYYNIANAYYKKGDVASCIYFYEKALRISPNDSDIKNNLQLAQKMIIEPIKKTYKNWIDIQLISISNWFSLSNWANISIILSFILFFVFTIYYITKNTIIKRGTFAIMISLFLLSLISTYLCHFISKEQEKTFAIVFDSKIKVYSEPNDFSQEIFSIYAGNKIQVLETLDKQWIKIKINDEKIGWTLIKSVKTL